MGHRAIAGAALLFAAFVYGQDGHLERRILDFESKGAGLTETLLSFSHQQHLPVAIEYLDRASFDPVDVNLKDMSVRSALNSILRNGNGYNWNLQKGMVVITNRLASKHAEHLLNTVIPVFKISEGQEVNMTSFLLERDLQIALDPSLKGKGFGGDMMGKSSTVKPATLRGQTVREILSYIVLNSQAEGWIVAGPLECLGYMPYCGLWYVTEGDGLSTPYTMVSERIRDNLMLISAQPAAARVRPF